MRRRFLEPSPDLLYAGTLRYATCEWHVVVHMPAPDDETVGGYLIPSDHRLDRIDINVPIAFGLVLPESPGENPDPELLTAAGQLLGKSLLPSLRRVLPIARGSAS